MTDYDEIARATRDSVSPCGTICDFDDGCTCLTKIAEALRNAHAAGVAEERERCARVAEEWASIEGIAQYIAAAIRSGK
jgi:hypothetical protein